MIFSGSGATPETPQHARLMCVEWGVVGRRRVARKTHRCQWGDCRSIPIGDVYVESTSFPGHDSGYATAAGKPVRMALCARCALRYGYDIDIPYDQLCRDGLL